MIKHFLTLLLWFPALVQADAGSTRLAELLRATLNHPQVEAARLHRSAAENEAAAERGRLFGQVELNAGWRRHEGPRILGYYAPGAGPLPPTDREVASLGISYVLPVDLAGELAANRERARHDVRAAELFEARQRLSKLHQTTESWLALQVWTERQQALDAYRKRVESTHARILNEVRLGKTAVVEARNADSELARLAAEQAALDGRLRDILAQLAEATGEEFAGLNGQFSSVIPIPDWQAATPDATLVARQAEARMEAADAGARAARRALYPKLDIVADYSDQFGADTHRDTWFAGVVASLPLDITANRKADARRFSAAAATAERESARREARRQLTALRASYDAARADAIAVEREIAYREDVVRVRHEMARMGAQTLETLYQHERDLLDARTRLAEARARATLAWSAAQVLSGMDADHYISQLDMP